jgi:hypothetical protein
VRLRPILATLVALLAVAVAGPAAAMLPDPHPAGRPAKPFLAGITFNPPDEREPSDLFALRDAGVNFYLLPQTWAALEPEKGSYALSHLDIALLLPEYGFTLGVWVAPIETTLKHLPPDLAGRPYDDPVVRARFRRLLQDVLDRADGRISQLYLGSEADIYLSLHPEELPAFTRLLRDSIAFVHDRYPGVAVGISTTIEGIASEPAIVRALNRHTDLFAVSYYPDWRKPLSIQRDLARIRAIAGRKPVMFEQVGFPSSTAIGSSEARQAEFFRRFFAALRTPGRPRVIGAEVTWLFEASEQDCRFFEDYYGFHDDAFRAFLCSLGLLRSDETPKPAYDVVMAAIGRVE